MANEFDIFFKRFDILLDNHYSSLTSQKRKEIILINDLGFNNTSNLTIDYISLAFNSVYKYPSL